MPNCQLLGPASDDSNTLEGLPVDQKPRSTKTKLMTYPCNQQVRVPQRSRCKARLVLQGCKQEKGPQKHQSIFAPVVKGVTIRLTIALVCMLRLHIHQMDMSNRNCGSMILLYAHLICRRL